MASYFASSFLTFLLLSIFVSLNSGSSLCSPTDTTAAYVVKPYQLSNQILNLEFRRPLSAVSKILVGADNECNYPGEMWQKEVKDCEEVYTFRLPWALSKKCGFQKTSSSSNAENFKYQASFDFGEQQPVTVDMFFPRSRSKRSMSAPSPRSVPISVGVVSETPSITQPVTVTVVFQTITDWPFALNASTAPTLSGSVSGVQSVVVNVDTDMYVQSCTTGNRCTQQWVATIVLEANECEAGGTYNFDATLICQYTNQSYCPNPTSRTFSITASSTASLCTPAEIVATDGGKSNLVSYKDSSREFLSNTFDVGDFTYWSLNVVDNQVSIDSITINKVELVREADGTVATLFQNGNGVSTAWIDSERQEINSLVTVGTKAMLNFTILLDRVALSSTIGSVSVTDSSESFTLKVYVILSYHGNFKRSVVLQPISRVANAGIVVKQKQTTHNIKVEASPRVTRSVQNAPQNVPQNLPQSVPQRTPLAQPQTQRAQSLGRTPSSSFFNGIFGSGSSIVTVPHSLLVFLIALGICLVVGL